MPRFWFNVQELEAYQYNGTPPEITNLCVCISSKTNVMERYGLKGVIALAKDLQEKFASRHGIRSEDEDAEDYIWRIICDEVKYKKREKAKSYYAKRTSVEGDTKKPSARGGKGRVRRPREYEIKFDPLDHDMAVTYGQLVPQARKVLDALLELETRIISEQAALDVVEEFYKKGELKTVQTPKRIFDYYECYLERKGMLQRRYL